MQKDMMRSLGIVVLVLLAACFLLVFACSDDDDDDDVTPTATPTQQPGPTATPTPPPEGTEVGNYAEDFTLNDRNETAHSLSQYKGSVILLDISAMWCGPCQAEAAKAEALYQKYKDQGFIILSVLIADYQNNRPDAADCATWADKYGLTIPVLYDGDRAVWNSYKGPNSAIPLNLVIDRNHVIQYKMEGYDEAAIVALIEQYL